MTDRIMQNTTGVLSALLALGQQRTVKVGVVAALPDAGATPPPPISHDGVVFEVTEDLDLLIAAPGRYDVIIFCGRNAGEESVLMELRDAGVARLYFTWFWHNHLEHVINLRLALLSDAVFVAQWHERHYLNHPAVLPGAYVPAFTSGAPPAVTTRRDALYGHFDDRTAPARHRFLTDLRTACPGCVLNQGPANAADGGYKVRLIAPSAGEMDSSIFDALRAGQIPLVADDIAGLDQAIAPSLQAELPILRYQAVSPISARAAWREAIRRFDMDGTAGIERRYTFAAEHHNLAARLANFASFIRTPGEFTRSFDNDVVMWDRWR